MIKMDAVHGGAHVRPETGAAGSWFYVTVGMSYRGFRHVSVSAGNDDGLEVPLAGRSVFVVTNTKMQDTVLEARVRSALEDGLLDRGYKLASAPNADLYVMASFGTVDEVGVASVSTVRPAGVRVERAPNGSLVRKRYADEIEHTPVLQVQNTISVLVSAADAQLYRETGRVATIWVGEASTPGKPELLPKLLPYLLTSAVRYFGRNSGGVQSIDVHDREIRNWPAAK
jgi:hypothetical protein